MGDASGTAAAPAPPLLAVRLHLGLRGNACLQCCYMHHQGLGAEVWGPVKPPHWCGTVPAGDRRGARTPPPAHFRATHARHVSWPATPAWHSRRRTAAVGRRALQLHGSPCGCGRQVRERRWTCRPPTSYAPITTSSLTLAALLSHPLAQLPPMGVYHRVRCQHFAECGVGLVPAAGGCCYRPAQCVPHRAPWHATVHLCAPSGVI